MFEFILIEFELLIVFELIIFEFIIFEFAMVEAAFELTTTALFEFVSFIVSQPANAIEEMATNVNNVIFFILIPLFN